MGMGQLVTDYEARPWLERVQLHTQAFVGWEIVHRVNFNKGKIPVSDRQKQLVGARRAAGFP
jgi:hypothetical protein